MSGYSTQQVAELIGMKPTWLDTTCAADYCGQRAVPEVIIVFLPRCRIAAYC